MNLYTIGCQASPATLCDFADQFQPADDSNNVSAISDKLDTYRLAALFLRLAELPESRAQRIVEIRRQIQDGTYESSSRLEIATERIAREL